MIIGFINISFYLAIYKRKTREGGKIEEILGEKQARLY